MRFTLTIDCDNAAFGEDDADLFNEVAWIIRKQAEAMDAGMQPNTLRDSNGNTVGSANFTGKRAKAAR